MRLVRKYLIIYISNRWNCFYLGCIYNTWTDKETGEMKDTFSIITTEANPMMEHIHNSKKRMPLIMRKDDIATWIDPETNAETVAHLMSCK